MIGVERGDITNATADAIVCSVGGVLEAAILQAAGPRLAEALKLIKRPGVTHAGDLDARFVIHTVVPMAGEDKLVACYRAVFAQAAALDCQSVAVPALGAGAGFHAYRVAVSALAAATESTIPDVRFWLPTDEVYDSFDQALLFHEPPLRAARKADWKTEPWPALRPIDFEQTLEPGAAAALLLGTVPEEMENKWFVFAEDGQLLFHRSWTGILVFRVALTHEADGRLRLHNALRNADPEVYKGDDAGAADALANLVGWLSQRRS